MFSRYYVENWILIMNINYLSLWSIPKKILKRITINFEIYFQGCMHKFYVVNPSRSFRWLWLFIKRFDFSQKVSFSFWIVFIADIARRQIAVLSKKELGMIIKDNCAAKFQFEKYHLFRVIISTWQNWSRKLTMRNATFLQ